MRPGRRACALDAARERRLVGCGAVARSYYAPALTRLLARLDRRGAALRRAGTGDGGRRPAAGGHGRAELGGRAEGPDELAIVASPPVAHAEQVRALLEHGKHVLCEKPFVLDRAAAESLVDLARERGRFCAAGMVRRFSRSACLLRQLLSEERPTRLVWHEGSPFRWPVDSPAYFAPEAGNQLLWDIGSHVVDLLVWWLGARTSSRAATTRWAGRRRTACSSLAGRTAAARGAAEPRVRPSARARRRAPLRRPRLPQRDRGGRPPCLRRSRGTGLRAADPGSPPPQDERSPTASSSSSRTCSPPSAVSRRSGRRPRTCSKGSERSRRWRQEAGSSSRRG